MCLDVISTCLSLERATNVPTLASPLSFKITYATSNNQLYLSLGWFRISFHRKALHLLTIEF